MQRIPPAYDWESQAQQYAYRDTPGICYERHSTYELGAQLGDKIAFIDCLLYRDEDGLLVGILNYYPNDNEWEQAGNVNMWVKPDHQRQGIGTALAVEGLRRWPDTDLEQQRYTSQGLLFFDALCRRGVVTKR